MKIFERLEKPFSRLWKYIVNFIFPNRCPFCKQIIHMDSMYCSACHDELPIHTNKDIHLQGLDELMSCFDYADRVRNAIWRFKFRSQPELAKTFANLIMENLSDRLRYPGFDIVSYVPMRRSKQKLRGYNQAEVLAKELAKCLDIKFEKELISKVKDNSIQHKLSAVQRRKNVHNAYRVTRPDDVMDKRILVVDDVFTTGATLCECGKCFKMESAAWVSGLTIAHTKLEYREKRSSEIDSQVSKSRIWEDGDCEAADLLCKYDLTLKNTRNTPDLVAKGNNVMPTMEDFDKYLLDADPDVPDDFD